jgi:ABC-type lipoprotein export system ATPase subunit
LKPKGVQRGVFKRNNQITIDMKTTNFSRGSEWGKWDLHFHTPSSKDYDDNSVTNQDIITALQKENIVAVAITDHHFIDVERINKLRELSATKITIFPGIEFCSDSRGDEPIHFIGIFPDSSDIQFIWNEINSKADIAKQINEGKKDNEIYCKLEKTSKLIKELGGLVTIHAGRKSNSIEKISNSLPVKMAEKVDIANNIQIFELGQERDQEDYIKKVFPKIGIRPMIICSDNHNAKNYKLKSNCWIKANPTFDGLRQVLHEPKDRIFIGEKPEILIQADENPTKYIDSVTINQEDAYKGNEGKWFKDINIQLNHELITIIGNKGKGKSAIAEIIGLCGNSRIRESDLSFLNAQKFKKAKLAQNFHASIFLHSNLELSKNLNDSFSADDVEYIKYIPQGYFNTLCNEIGKSKTFEDEIEKVVFQHLDTKNRLGKNSFGELIEYKKTIIDQELEILKKEISEINSKIIKLEKKKNTNYIVEIQKNIEKKQRELDAHDKNKPATKTDPNKDKRVEEEAKKLMQEIDALKEKVGNCKKEVLQKEEEIIKLAEEQEELTLLRDNIKLQGAEFERFKNNSKTQLLKYNLDIENIVKLLVDVSSIETLIAERKLNLDKLQKELIGEEAIQEETSEKKNKGLKDQLISFENELNERQKLLDKPTQEYQKYLKEIETWEKKRTEIEGSESVFDTLKYYLNEKKYIEETLNEELSKNREIRINKLVDIYLKKAEIIDIYKKIKEKIDTILEANKDYLDEYKVNIEASFELSPSFNETFLWHINRKSAGTFYSIEGSEKVLSKILEEKNFNKIEDLKLFINTILDFLEFDKRDEKNILVRNIEDQIKDIDEFYDYLFSIDYLTENYRLKLAGKDLNQLSPGEKGALLLVFYLLLDKDDKPLIIDQPEDNLDNQSVAEILVPFIKQAKKRRQIIMVTHNPNLAVVADAEQVIHVTIDKEKENEFSFNSGSIENAEINKCIVDILEGTMPAFDKRRMKYKKG